MAKYGPKAHELVEREMEQMKAGKLRSGSGEKVTNPKQAIAIALSEARRSGVKMPAPPPGTASADKAPSDDRAARKTAAKKKQTKKAEPKKGADGKATEEKTGATRTDPTKKHSQKKRRTAAQSPKKVSGS